MRCDVCDLAMPVDELGPICDVCTADGFVRCQVCLTPTDAGAVCEECGA